MLNKTLTRSSDISSFYITCRQMENEYVSIVNVINEIVRVIYIYIVK